MKIKMLKTDLRLVIYVLSCTCPVPSSENQLNVYTVILTLHKKLYTDLWVAYTGGQDTTKEKKKFTCYGLDAVISFK